MRERITFYKVYVDDYGDGREEKVAEPVHETCVDKAEVGLWINSWRRDAVSHDEAIVVCEFGNGEKLVIYSSGGFHNTELEDVIAKVAEKYPERFYEMHIYNEPHESNVIYTRK